MIEVFKQTGEEHRFGGYIVTCPACGIEKFAENSIRMHITSTARGELWDREFDPEIKTPHLDFYRTHTFVHRKNRIWAV